MGNVFFLLTAGVAVSLSGIPSVFIVEGLLLEKTWTVSVFVLWMGKRRVLHDDSLTEGTKVKKTAYVL